MDASEARARLGVVGANHRSSSAATRDALFVPEAEMRGFLAELRRAGLAQALLISTCDRVEVQFAASDVAAGRAAVLDAFARRLGRDAGSETYSHEDEAALRHVFAVAAYQQLADACDYPLHLGITEAGALRMGTIKSAIGMGSLLWAGIGDTIRVSLSADPVEEVKVGYDILKAMGLRRRGVTVIACPSCARQQFDVIKTVERLEERLSKITVPMTLSVIGCVVNGPGEARETDIGFTGGGNGTHLVYVAGQQDHRLKDGDIVEHLAAMVEKKAAEILAAEAAKAAE